MHISAIILAAGESSRFPKGKLTRIIRADNKDEVLIKYLVNKFLSVNEISEVIVVIGYNPLEIINSINTPEVKFVYNPDYKRGMSYSVKAGVRAVLKYVDIVLIHPGDVFFVRTTTIKNLVNKAIELFSKNGDFIIIPKYGLKGGHPLIISKRLIPHVLEIKEEERGLKGFLNRFSDKKVYIETDDIGVLYDVDTPEDLIKAEKIFGIKWIK